MCGIVGQIELNKTPILLEVETACKLLHHRGPDGWGVKSVSEGIAFGHTRLSFLDLSDKGQQPMSSNSDNTHITFNGEIYNYKELRDELSPSYSFQTTSDTEVILAAYEQWGIACLEKFEGMFAFCLYDAKKQQAYFVRDRFGVKPLYFYKEGDSLLFASELKAFTPFGSFEKNLDWSSFCDFFVYRYVPSPKTIWVNTYKVEPAQYICVNTQDLSIKKEFYWTPNFDNKSCDEAGLIKKTNQLLESSIDVHSRADVPVGAFLSGGYDSSAIVYYLNKLNYQTATFSIGFEGWDKSEDYFAQIVANHLQVKNEKVLATEKSLDLIEKMPDVYDEPIADISIIPTYMVSQLAAKSVKAVMGGEGADEIFGGYHWQKSFYKQQHPTNFKDRVLNWLKPVDTVDYYAQAMAMGWFDGEELQKMLHPRLHNHIPKDVHWFYRKHTKSNLSPLKTMQYLDLKCFMTELVLVKVDRASMANSLEVRVPFLNHHLYDFILSLDEDIYYKDDVTKFALHQNLYKHLPKEIMDRGKQGFVGPDSYYMNKKWYAKQLADSVLVKDQVIQQSYIDKLLKEDYDWKIWKILVMEKWYAKWLS